MKQFANILAAMTLGTLVSVAPFFALYPVSADATVYDATNNPTLFQNLPSCTANRDMSKAAITDGPANPAFGQTVTGGGGTSHDLLLCNGAATNWIVIAGGAGGSSSISPTVLNAPVTSVSGNYGNGCTSSPAAASSVAPNHNCMSMDDHWTSTSLNVWSPTNTTGPWYNAFFRCNGSSGGGASANCGIMPYNGGPFPAPTFIDPLMSSWGNGPNDGWQSFVGYSFGYGTSQTFTGLTLTHTPLSKNSDGTLRMASKWYFPNPNNNSGGGWCDSRTDVSAGLNCNYINWIGPQMSLGGLNTSTNMVGNTNALIPLNGGMVQWRMKLDGTGLQNGMYPIMECEAVDTGTTLNGTVANVNMEYGYTHVNGPLQSVGMGMNNTANGLLTINTGDDGVGSGNLTNWHTYGFEWTGPTTHEFHYYVDGVERTNQEVGGNPTVFNNQIVNGNLVRNPTFGWSCTLSQGSALTRYSGFHSEWDNNATSLGTEQSTPTNGPGPYFMDISDVQVYKKPNT